MLNDKRHSDITMLNYSEIVKREFEQWSMGYMPQKSLTDSLNLKYSATPNFDPYEMSGESTH
ncbi:MAG: BLUF domain-containing protein [Alteromonadaceae bacterium]